MNKTYYATVVRTGNKNELVHWKYVKKVKKNGKWRYYYDTDALKKDISKSLGIDAKEQMSQIKEDIHDANKKLENMQNYANSQKAVSSKNQEENIKLQKKLSEARYDAGLEAAKFEGYVKQLLDSHNNDLEIPEEKRQVAANMAKKHDELLTDIVDYRKKIKQLTSDNAQIEKNLLRIEKINESTKREIDKLVNSYESQKSIYDKSIVGFIDRGKKAFDEWWRKFTT